MKWNIGWEVMVLGIAFLFVLAFVAVILILRERHSHRTRVGFFVERDRWEDELPSSGEVGGEAPTDEWPVPPR